MSKPGEVSKVPPHEKPFSYVSHNGTRFTASRCDFLRGVTAYVLKGATLEQQYQDVTEMIGFHAIHIMKELGVNNFRGYNAVHYTSVSEE
jgi:hypothetical protein